MKALTPISIPAPGSKGLITELAAREVGHEWCTRVRNAVITKSGVLGARKGWDALTLEATGGAKEQVFEYVDGTNTRIISAGDNKLYEGTVTLADVTGTVTPTANNWQFVNFNSKVLGFQAGHDPIVKSGAGNFETIAVAGGGTLPQSDVVLAAFGRVWSTASGGTVLRYSDLLNETAWDDSSSPGSAGLIDLHTVWPSGTDRVVALAEFNNYLVIFGRRSILIYGGADDPSTMALSDQIWNMGCVARDSVQSLGDDIVFLTDEGVMLFSRALQSGGLPLRNASRNVRSRLKIFVDSEIPSQIRSTYNATEGFYLLSFPTSDKVFCFDARGALEDGSSRTTEWDQITPTGMYSATDGTLYLGQDGSVGVYRGAQDNGESYEFEVELGWTSGEQQLAFLNKIMKHATTNATGGSGQTLTFKWAFDFGLAEDSSQDATKTGSPSEWNIAEYDIGEYSGGAVTSALRFRMSGSGKTLRLGYRMVVNGSRIDLNRTDLFFKIGSIV